MRRVLAVLVVLLALPAGAALPLGGDGPAAGDASDDYSTPTRLELGLGASRFGAGAWRGAVGGSLDPRDVFGVDAREGDKLFVGVEPAPWGVALRIYRPLVAGRAFESNLPLASPERGVLNLDASGVWLIAIESSSRTEYAFEVSLSPRASAPPGSFGAGCPTPGPVLTSGAPWVNSFDGGEEAHWYRVFAQQGDSLVVALAVDDVDGTDFDVTVRDAQCGWLAHSKHGKFVLFPGLGVMGTPELAVRLEAPRTEFYHVEVTRASGVGAYAVGAFVVTDEPRAQS